MKDKNSQKIWLGFAERRSSGDGRVKIRLRWLRILGATCVLGIVGYATLMAGVYWWLKNKRGYHQVTYVQTLMVPLPWEYRKVKQEQGVAQVERGLELAKKATSAEEIIQAERWVRAGLTRAPDQLKGRMFVAQMLELRKQPPEYWVKVYEDGLQYADRDVEYLKGYLRALLSSRNDQQILDVAERYLPEQPDRSDELNRVMALAGMRAATEVGNFERAHELYRQYGLDNNPEAVMSAAELLDRAGQTDDAIVLLQSFIARYNVPQLVRHVDPARKLLMALHNREGNYTAAAEVCLQRVIAQPENPAPRIDLLKIYDEQGREREIEQQVEDLLRNFGDDRMTVISLANFATDTGRLDLVRRVYETAIESNFDLSAFGMIYIEAYLTSGHYKSALDFCEELEREAPSWLASYRPVISAMRSVAHHGLGDEKLGEMYLTEFLGNTRVSSSLLRTVAKRFRNMDLDEQARRVLLDAHERQPREEDVLADLVEVELELGESRTITDHVASLLEVRRPRYNQLQDFYNGLNSDRFIFSPERQVRISSLADALEEAQVAASLDFSLRSIEEIRADREQYESASANPTEGADPIAAK
ncbi:MAG: hypothetical protein Q7P63_12370 [Verrucomicrobiota bacterium JB022]|nr:hypothetical protein [Verrucomicrobiota bacterium JB022]